MFSSKQAAAPSWSRWIPVVSSAALAACASSAHEQRYQELSRALASEVRAEAEVPLPEGPVLERAELVRAVLARNPGIDEARQAWRAAMAEVPQAAALADPMAEYMFAPLSIGSEHDYGQIVTLSQELPWPGKLDLREQMALAEAEAARADFRAVQLRLALSASTLFDEYYAAARSLAITAEHERLVRDILAISEAQYQAGRTPQGDVLEAEVELAHIEHRRVTLESERDVAIARLNGLLHRAPDAPLPPPPETLELPADEPPPVDALVEAALAARPELAARRARIEARDAAVDLAERESYPDLQLMASYDSMEDGLEHELMIGVGVNLPIWRERRAAAVDEARAQRASTAAALEAARDEIRAEVAAARHRLVEARHVVHLYRERLIPTARAQVEAARIGYETGGGDFQALIAAERNRRQLELDRELALATLQKRRAELERALGRVPGLEVSR